jgi:hypothetical protein
MPSNELNFAITINLILTEKKRKRSSVTFIRLKVTPLSTKHQLISGWAEKIVSALVTRLCLAETSNP